MTSTSLTATTPVDLLALELVANGAPSVGAVSDAQASLLASPLRRLRCNPASLLAPHVREGMTVLEPGPGMGFFTLELARRVGHTGRVIAVDVQPPGRQG